MDKKVLVINCARELFTEYGYKKVSMDEIAKSSGVTKKTIYSYFKDKDEIFQYFVLEELEKMKQMMETTNNNLSLIEIVSKDIYNMLMFRKTSKFFSMIKRDFQNDEKSSKFLEVFDDEIINYIKEKIRIEIKKGNIKDCDVELTAFIIYKIFISVLFEYKENIDELKITQEVANILKNGLLN